jgi:L-asparaginase II
MERPPDLRAWWSFAAELVYFAVTFSFMSSDFLVNITRNGIVESVHIGHLSIVDGNGQEIVRCGAPETTTFYRSSAKPFQALPVLTSGAAERYGLSEREIALACGSHNGEPLHTETAANMLEKCGLGESDLRCGAHLPFNEDLARQMIERGEKPNQLHNNCSGKHAAMLAFAKHIGTPIETYDHYNHPIQQEILRVISLFSGLPVAQIGLGIDGCSAPNFAVPVRAMAEMYARLVFPPEDLDAEMREACRRIVSAMMSYPEMVGGSVTERLDTEIMRAASGKLISKIGAEGVWTAGVLPSPRWKRGLGIAFKISDGDDKRARPVAALEILRQLGVLEPRDFPSLRIYAPLILRNRREIEVGEVTTEIDLKL